MGCLTCSNVCPANAIVVSDDKETGLRKITRDYGKCIFCGQCERYCITGEEVILYDKIYDLSGFDRKKENIVEEQEKELLLCENCGAIITTKEHIQYLHKKLGAKAYSSLLDLNTLNDDFELSSKEEIKTEVIDGLQRKDSFKVLCPNCLHKSLLNNLLPNE